MRYGSRQVYVDYFEQGNIGDIKEKLFSIFDILPIHQILIYNREVLHNG